MDQQETVREIEERAFRAYSSVRAVCLRAGIAPSTFQRWKKTSGNPDPIAPNWSTLRKVFAALEAIEAEAKQAPKRSGVAA